jgi:hypothetical protein
LQIPNVQYSNPDPIKKANITQFHKQKQNSLAPGLGEGIPNPYTSEECMLLSLKKFY